MLKMVHVAAAEHKRVRLVREAKAAEGAIIEVDSKTDRWIVVTWNKEETLFYLTAQSENASSVMHKCETKELSATLGRLM